jgi:predicted Zn-dependent protease with MMP-like domain
VDVIGPEDPIDPETPEAADAAAESGDPDPAESAAESAESAEPDPFEDLVFAALDSLPPVFRDRLGSVAVVVEDEPTPEKLARVGAPGLFGLYEGVPRTAYGSDQAALTSKITIYRGSHLRAYRTPEALAAGVADTVRHEVAHHFGISDERLIELAREHRRG